MFGDIDILRIAQALILVFGSVVVYSALRGYRRRNSKALLLLAVGFGIVTIGAIASGILFEILSADLLLVEVVQAVSQAAGFFVIVYSLIGASDRTRL